MKKIILALILLTSCYIPDKQPKVEVYTQRDTITVTGMNEVYSNATFFSNAHKKYYVAFSDGEDKRVTFGVYSLLSVGDTIIKTKLNTEFYWNYQFKDNQQ